MKHVNVNLTDTLAENYARVYGKATPGVAFAAEAFMTLRTRSLARLKGIFSEQEITAICDCYNGIMPQPEFMSRDVFIAQLEDSEKYQSISSKHEFSLENLREKVEKLHDSEVFFLLDRIYSFWETESSNPDSLTNLVKEFEK
jgi:hypothetical protein